MTLDKLFTIEVENKKIIEYLLNFTHEEGKHNATFFSKHGYSIENSNDFVAEFVRIAKNNEIEKVIETKFGRKFIIKGEITSKYSKKAKIITVWFVAINTDIAKLVTSYPE